MSIITSQQLTRFVEQYGHTEVTFTKQVISATGLLTKGVYLKLLDRQHPCVIFSSSMASAKVIAGIRAAFFDSLRQAGSKLALRWCFKVPQESEPIMFYVSCHASGFTPYNPENPDVQLLSLEYTQRPPDDLIMILGNLLEATTNSQRRKDERVTMTPESMKKLGIDSRDAVLSINGNPHKGILRDLSFGGANVLLPAVPHGASGSTVTLRIDKGDQSGESFLLLGSIRRIEKVGGRKDISVVAIEYVRDPPLTYKVLINTYLATQRKTGAETPLPMPAPSSPSSARSPDDADFPEEENADG